MEELNYLDVAIVTIIVLSTLISIYRGFVRELFTLVVWGLALVLSYIHGAAIGDKFSFIDSPYIKQSIGVFLIFTSIILIGGIIKFVTIKKYSIGNASGLDRVGGAFFGVARGALIIILAIIFIDSTNIVDKEWYKNSRLIADFEEAADFVDNGEHEGLKKFKIELNKKALDAEGSEVSTTDD